MLKCFYQIQWVSVTVIAGCLGQARPNSRKNLPNTEFNISLASNNVTAIIFIPEIGPVLRSFNSRSDCLILSFKLKGRQTATNNEIVSAFFSLQYSNMTTFYYRHLVSQFIFIGYNWQEGFWYPNENFCQDNRTICLHLHVASANCFLGN